MDYGTGERDAAHGVRSMILIADGGGSRARGAATARDAGLDVAAVLTFAESLAVEDAALASDLLFVEAAADGGVAFDQVLGRVAGLARGGQAVIVSIVPELIDPATTVLDDAPVDLLCSTGAADRLAAVAGMLAGVGSGVRQDAPGRAEDLRSIGIDLGRIAERLVGLADGSRGLEMRPEPVPPEAGGETVMATAGDYRLILRKRRLRDLYLGDGLFADPAWDMMLDLAAARLEGEPVAVSSLCIAAAVPPTTALRWIKALTDRGILCRTPDRKDGRRVFMTLSDATVDAMDAYVHATRTLENA